MVSFFVELWQHKCEESSVCAGARSTVKQELSFSTVLGKAKDSLRRNFSTISAEERRDCSMEKGVPAQPAPGISREPTAESGLGATPASDGRPVLQSSDSSEKQECPTCGKSFKQLSKHKCKGSESSDSSDQQECPTCGKSFKQLSKHKCKGPEAAPTRDTRPASQSSGSSDQQECPTCGKSFKQLSKHKCKEPEAAPTRDTRPASQSSGSSDQQECPTCSKSFKQLSKHKCKGPEAASPQEAEIKQMCPSCNGMFKQLQRHKCKASSDVRDVASKEPPPTDETASLNVRGGECPTCGKYFDRVQQHKCKAGARPKEEPLPCSNTSDGASGSCQDSANVRETGTLLPTPRQSVGQTGTLDVGALEKQAEMVIESLKIEPAANPVRGGSAFFGTEVVVDRHEKETVARAFEGFRGRILSDLCESTSWKWIAFNSGSTYDGTKVR